MRRRLFNIAAALSLLMLVLTCVLWVRSYWVADLWYGNSPDRIVAVEVNHGMLILWSGHVQVGFNVPSGRSELSWTYSALSPVDYGKRPWPIWIERKGPDASGWVSGSEPFVRLDEVGVQFWLPFILLMSVPAWWLYAERRWPKRRDELCARCGYDLRATPERCPECGRQHAQALSQATPQ